MQVEGALRQQAINTIKFLAVDGGLTVGPRSAWDESAAVESWSRMGMSEEQVKQLLAMVTS